MAEENDDSDKTEDPTQKRLEEAHNRGDVVKSQEVNTWFVLAAATLVLMIFSGPMASDLAGSLRGIIEKSARIPMDGMALHRFWTGLGMEVIAAMAVPMLVLMLAALAGNMIQHRMVWSTEALEPKFSKLSPMAGFKRIFGKQAWANFFKGLVKLALIGTVMFSVLWPERRKMEALITTDLRGVVQVAKDMALDLLAPVLAIMFLIAAGDYLWQYRQWFNRHKMSLREIKDEFKQQEGDPHIKSKLRQIRQQRMRKRMMAAVPTASVVITNPTHFAVALKYETGMGAPICVAKGTDAVALRIREMAGKHEVPIVENPPLARALHASVDIDEEVPEEHYKAVAEVIGFVMRLRQRVSL